MQRRLAVVDAEFDIEPDQHVLVKLARVVGPVAHEAAGQQRPGRQPEKPFARRVGERVVQPRVAAPEVTHQLLRIGAARIVGRGHGYIGSITATASISIINSGITSACTPTSVLAGGVPSMKRPRTSRITSRSAGLKSTT